MLFQNKAIIAVSCILLSFGLLLAGAICNRMLDAPPTIPAYSIGENGETTAQETENPKYSDGTKREIVQFFYDVNPGGRGNSMFNNAACQFNTITYIFLSNNCPYNRCRCLDFQEKDLK